MRLESAAASAENIIKEDSMLAKCVSTNTSPKIMHTDTDTEMWEGRASLIYTDTEGNDTDLPENVRAYLFAACQHSPGSPTAKGFNQQLQNPLDYKPLCRALLLALDE